MQLNYKSILKIILICLRLMIPTVICIVGFILILKKFPPVSLHNFIISSMYAIFTVTTLVNAIFFPFMYDDVCTKFIESNKTIDKLNKVIEDERIEHNKVLAQLEVIKIKHHKD